MLMSALCQFRINNRFTFAVSFGRNLADPERRVSYREMVGDVIIAYLKTGTTD